ncbi:hypothetical protein EDF67_101732 [Sphingobacterium sp. JUb78]|nr:hypothetical protein [Sphingobacterium kitahiroshimense]TCR14627.1 hypothetical protein EDF67_101732 [Sphingobacterium sp. JUb78]
MTYFPKRYNLKSASNYFLTPILNKIAIIINPNPVNMGGNRFPLIPK